MYWGAISGQEGDGGMKRERDKPMQRCTDYCLGQLGFLLSWILPGSSEGLDCLSEPIAPENHRKKHLWTLGEGGPKRSIPPTLQSSERLLLKSWGPGENQNRKQNITQAHGELLPLKRTWSSESFSWNGTVKQNKRQLIQGPMTLSNTSHFLFQSLPDSLHIPMQLS